MLKDRFGRTVTYLRVSLIDRCNFRCLYCMPREHEPEFFPHDELLSYEELEKILEIFAALGVSSIRVTGGEPLARRDSVYFLEHLLSRRMFREVALTTNGLYLASCAGRLRRAGLRRVNGRLASLDSEKFRNLTRGGDVERAVAGLDAALAAGCEPVKINTVLMKGLNDGEIVPLARFALERGAHLRFIELMPVGGGGFLGSRKFFPLAEARRRLEKEFRIIPTERGPAGDGPARYAAVEGFSSMLGFIGALTCNFCARCNRMRLSSTGLLYPCLDRDDLFVNLRDPLRAGASPQDLAALVTRALSVKPERHAMELERNFVTHGSMSAVGG
jgi:cyclic pyranopterin phosphate synthase